MFVEYFGDCKTEASFKIQGVLSCTLKGFEWRFQEPSEPLQFRARDLLVFAKQQSGVYVNCLIKDYPIIQEELGLGHVEIDDQVSITFTPKEKSCTSKIFDWYKQSLFKTEVVKENFEWFYESDIIPDDFEIPSHIQIIEQDQLSHDQMYESD